MDPGLVRSLGHFFGIQMLLVCFDGGGTLAWVRDEIAAGIPWPVKLLHPRDLARIRDHSQNATVLVACQDLDFLGAQLSEGHFAPDVIWLAPASEDNIVASEQLPLSLYSNVLLYSEGAEHEENITVTEVYSIKSHHRRNNSFAQWTKSGLVVPEPATWNRRSNLTGITLVSTVLEWNPFSIMRPNGTITGFFPEILNALQDMLNFR